MASKKPQQEAQPIRFADAMEELQGILARLDREDVDLDDLSGLVERAAQLITVCRQRILTTDLRVREIIEQLAADVSAEGSEDQGEHEPSA